MTPLDFLAQPAWHRPALVLLHFLWQGAAILLLVELVIRLFTFRRAEVRHACCLAGLLAMAACPPITFFLLEPAPATVVPLEEPLRNVPLLAAEETPSHSSPLSHQPQAVPRREAPLRNVSLLAAGETPSHSSPLSDQPQAVPRWTLKACCSAAATTLSDWRPALLMAWLAGVCFFSGRMLLGFTVVRRLQRQAEPVTCERLVETVRRLAARIGLARPPRLAASHRIGDAMAVGLWRPLVLLPAAWLVELPPDVLEAVIAHELAHVRRRDLWINLLARSVETLLFYHPAVWRLTGRLRRERELCCDELAVSATGGRAEYARALETVAQRKVSGGSPILATGLGGKKMRIVDRVKHVLKLDKVDRRSGWWSAGIVALTIPLLFWAATAAWRPALADDEDRDGDRDRTVAEDREERGPRDGDNRRERGEAGERRDRDRGERDRPEREQAERGRRGDRPVRDADRDDLLKILNELRREVAELRREVHSQRRDGRPIAKPSGNPFAAGPGRAKTGRSGVAAGGGAGIGVIGRIGRAGVAGAAGGPGGLAESSTGRFDPPARDKKKSDPSQDVRPGPFTLKQMMSSGAYFGSRRKPLDDNVLKLILQVMQLQNDVDAKVLELASVNGKYSKLLKKFAVPDEAGKYGPFTDYGYYEQNPEKPFYKGYGKIPGGYWVYVVPHWYIWGEKPVEPFSRPRSDGALRRDDEGRERSDSTNDGDRPEDANDASEEKDESDEE